MLASTCLLFVPIVVGAVWASRLALRERQAELRDEAGAAATTSAAYLDRYLDDLNAMASALVRHPAVVALKREACDRLFGEVLRDQPLLLNVALNAPDAAIRGSGVPPPDVATRMTLPYVQQVVSSGRPVVSELTTGQVTHQPTVVLAYPVRGDDGLIVGVLGFDINLSQLQTQFGRIPLPDGSIVTLTDRAGRVLARSRDGDRYIGTTVSHPVDPSASRRAFAERDGDGLERIVGTAVVDRGAWVMRVGIPTRVAAQRLQPLWRPNVAISLTATLSWLLLSLWIAHHLSRQLHDLGLAAQRIAGGDLSPPKRGRVLSRELVELQDTFISMADRLRQSHEALDRQVEQERKTRETLESLQQQLVRQERLAAVGVLVSGVAHEMNNPLQAILGTAELLERRRDLPPETLEDVAFVKTQCVRAREIIRNLGRLNGEAEDFQHDDPPVLHRSVLPRV